MSASNQENGFEGKNVENTAVQDRFYIVHITVFMIGVASFIPITFFNTATEYWQFKFRDTSLNSTSSEDRNAMQSYFSVGIAVTGTTSGLIFQILGKMYIHRFDLKIRTIVLFLITTVPFMVATACIYINTDSWQVEFFVLTMILNSIILTGNAVNSINHYEIISKFPSTILGVYIAGQGVTGICNSLLQIFSLAIGTSKLGSAKIYFYTGTALLLVVLCLFMFIQNLKYYEFYNKKEIATKQDTFPELWDALKKIWKIGLMLISLVIAQCMLQPTITALVVSENEGSGLWSDVYFNPVITFLLFNILDFSGRIMASKFPYKLNGNFLASVSFVRMVIFIFLILFCNAQPRHHLPVLFPHDYQYIIIQSIYAITWGFLYSMTFTSIRSYLPPEKLNTGYSTILLLTSFSGSLSAIASIFAVYIL